MNKIVTIIKIILNDDVWENDEQQCFLKLTRKKNVEQTPNKIVLYHYIECINIINNNS